MNGSDLVSDPSGTRRALIVVENLSVPFDRRVWRECQALREAGYQVSTISPMGTNIDRKWHEVIDGISIYRYPIYQSSGGFLSYLAEFSIALLMSFVLMCVVWLREGFDVIQICNPPDLLIFPTLPFRLFGKRVIFDQHDVCPEIYQAQKQMQGRKDRVVRLLLRLEAWTYALSDVVMVVNESCRRIALGRGGRSPDDVFVVRNGPSLQNIQSAAPDPALKHGRTYLLSYVGMMGPQEGIDVLLRAVRDLTQRHGRRDFHVLIMGGGTVLEQMQRYAQELGVEAIVTFTGSVPYPQVMAGIASADLCLCPDPKTPLSDLCSLVKATEYMSLGRTFVAFDLDEVRLSAGDAAEYARAGDESDFADKVNLLLEDPDRRLAMGRRGRERVLERLTWEHSKKALYSAYDRAYRAKEHRQRNAA